MTVVFPEDSPQMIDFQMKCIEVTTYARNPNQ